MDNVSEKLEIRNKYRWALIATRDSICKLNTLHISSDEAKSAGIRQISMSLDESSENRPRFFTPYRANIDNLEDPDDLDPPRSYPTYQSDSDIRWNVYRLSVFMVSHMSPTMLNYPPGIYSKLYASSCPYWII